jgi:UDP-N-acetylglucosamine 2-epimerase (non-hydrolysing)
MQRIVHVVGARPNFMKVAPIVRAMSALLDEFEQYLVHTGQHYDDNMSRVFFEDLGLPEPDLNLEVGSGSHAHQTAQVMMRFEPVLLEKRFDWVFVPGDVNSTIACALVASKLGIGIAHIEAGLRSFDMTMPEEINRLLTDQIAGLLFTPSRDGDANLQREGIPPERIHFVGNVMIDSLTRLLPKAQERWPALRARIGSDRFVLVTLHRPSNVDQPETLRELLMALDDLAREIAVVFPVHPRTRQRIAQLGLEDLSARLCLLEPLAYLDFLSAEANASLVLTDSGGVQEETTYLGVPCLTARPNTERPVTITHGTNRLVASERSAIREAARDALDGRSRGTEARRCPELWDGHAADRVVETMRQLAGKSVAQAVTY